MIFGKLDRRITFQSAALAADAYGEPVETWADLASTPTVWAQAIPVRGQEQVEGRQPHAQRETRFRCRHRSDITERMRIVYNSENYDIRAVMELGRQEGLEILAVVRGEG